VPYRTGCDDCSRLIERTARTTKKIAELGMFTNWRSILVRDDYAGWYQFDAQLAGVQQRCSHLIRHLHGVLDLGPRPASTPPRPTGYAPWRRWRRSASHSRLPPNSPPSMKMNYTPPCLTAPSQYSIATDPVTGAPGRG
jgi:hypothetical protein